MHLKKLVWLTYRLIRKFLRIITGYKKPEGFRHVSVVCKMSESELTAFAEKVRWYAPDRINFYVVSDADVPVPANVFINKEAEADFYLIKRPLCIIRNLFRLHRSAVIDPNFYSTEECTAWSYLYFQAVGVSDHLRELSSENFAAMSKKLEGKNEACCFLTGASFSDYEKFPETKNMVKIICNSIVKNDEFMDWAEPDILVFADPVYHFSYNEYAVRFRQDVLKTVRKYGVYVIIPMNMMPLMLAHYPELKHRLIGMELSDGFHFPSPGGLSVKSTDNILTYLMLPAASALCRKIYMLGADGRAKDDKMFWTHNSRVQYDSLMQKVVDAHPSFFRDRNYVQYQKDHDEIMEALFAFGEKCGRSYVSLNRSNLDSINKRFEARNDTETETEKQ